MRIALKLAQRRSFCNTVPVCREWWRPRKAVASAGGVAIRDTAPLFGEWEVSRKQRKPLCDGWRTGYSQRMNRRTPRFRYFALAFVALQLMLRVAAGVADARLSAASGPWEHFVHFESKGSNHIPPEHGTDCGLCSYVSASFTRSPAVGLQLPPVQRPVPFELRTPRALRGVSAVLPPARAPPAV